MLYFRKNYWKIRDKIFRKIYNILIGKVKKVKSEIKSKIISEVDTQDDFSDIKNLDDDIFTGIFEIQNVNKNLKNIENNNNNESIDDYIEEDEDEEEEEEEDNNKNSVINFSSIKEQSTQFIKKMRNKIFSNYLNNYKGQKIKIINDSFSLKCDENKIIYFTIQNVNIFEINYLFKIDVNGKKEWICNPYYGLYLCYYIRKIDKPYPILPKENQKIIQKTINDCDYLNFLFANNLCGIYNYIYNFELNDIIKDIKYHFDFKLMENKSKFLKYLNIKNDEEKRAVNFDELNYIIGEIFDPQIVESSNYIFQNKNNSYNKYLIQILNEKYCKFNQRYLYLDFDYIENIQTNKELKEYFAYWLIKSFEENDIENYEKTYDKIKSLIKKNNIFDILKEIIKIIQNLYNSKNNKKLHIILNKINKKRYHLEIDRLNDELKKVENYTFIIFCDIEEDINSDIFFKIYNENPYQLYFLKNSKNSNENINVNDIKIYFLIMKEVLNIFVI